MAFRGILERPESSSERFLREFSNFGQTLQGIQGDTSRRSLEAEKMNLEKSKLGLAGEKLGIEREKLQQKPEDKFAEKRRPYEVGLQTIEFMKPLIDKLGSDPLTLISGFIPGTETSAAVQQYRTYANSLLGVLSTIPVRNQKEFESVQKALASPHASQAELRAATEAAENILSSHLESLGGMRVKESKPEEGKPSKVKFNASSKEHQAKARQLMKKYNDLEKVRQELRREFEGVDVD